MSFQELVQWYNLIFILPVAIAALITFLLITGTVSGDHEGAIDHGHGFDHDADHGIEHHDGHSVGHDGHQEAGAFSKILSFLGIGRVPISIVLMCFFFTWGITGWISNLMIREVVPIPDLYIWVSLVVAGVSAITVTRLTSNALARALPRTQSYGVRREDLSGLTGKAVHNITPTFGTVLVYDQHGTQHEVECRVKEGDPILPSGSKVTLLQYNPETRSFIGMTDDQLSSLIEDRRR